MKRASLLIALAAMALVGCGPRVPDEFEEDWNRVASQIQMTESMIKSFEARVDDRLKDKELGPVIKELSESQGFKAAFEKGRADLKTARTKSDQLYKVARSRSQTARADFNRLATEIDTLLASAQNVAKRPRHLTDLVTQASRYSADMRNTAKGWRAELERERVRVEPIVERAQSRHANKKDDLAARLRTVDEVIGKAKTGEAAVQTEGAKNPVPLGAFAVAFEGLETAHLSGTALLKDLEARCGQLDRTYTRTLVDMKAEYKVVFGRASWDSSSDYGEQTHLYSPVIVSPREFVNYVKNPNNVQPVGIDPFENRPGSHDGSEFWIEDTDEAFFHQYIVHENGVLTRTDWVPVDDDDFYANVENLGMDILNKPYGMYDDEAEEEAAPAGYAYVGNPRYGTWNNGVWTWLPAYLLWSNLYGGRRYMYNDWDDWRRNYRGARPYYGRRTGDENEYGTYGSAGRGYFGGTTWARSGGLNRQDPTIRDLARNFRSGGPGGGGK